MIKKCLFATVAIGAIFIGFFFIIQKNSLAPQCPVNTLIVGVCDDFPPYTFNKDGKVIGFDIDLVHEMAKRMTKEVQLRVMSFDMLLLELERGSIDILASGINPTPERARRVSFSRPYTSGDDLVAMTCKGSNKITNVHSLVGKRVGVNEGYAADMFISAHEGIVVDRIENVAKAVLALKSGKIDAFVTERAALKPYLSLHGSESFDLVVVRDGAQEVGCAVGVSRKHEGLLEKINATLMELEEDETLADLKKRWSL